MAQENDVIVRSYIKDAPAVEKISDAERRYRSKLAKAWERCPDFGSPEHYALGGGKSSHFNCVYIEDRLKQSK